MYNFKAPKEHEIIMYLIIVITGIIIIKILKI